MEKEKGVIIILKKLLTWQTLAAIATIIMLVFVIVDHSNKKKKVDLMRDSVLGNIEEIEKDFHPTTSTTNNDSISLDYLIQRFQKDALSICAAWKSLDNMQDFEGTPTNSPHLLIYLRDMQAELNQREKQLFIDILLVYASTDTVSRKTINVSKIESPLPTLLDKKRALWDKYLDKAVKQSYKGNFKSVYKTLDKIKKEEDYYSFEIELFKYIIELNVSFTEIMRNHHSSNM